MVNVVPQNRPRQFLEERIEMPRVVHRQFLWKPRDSIQFLPETVLIPVEFKQRLGLTKPHKVQAASLIDVPVDGYRQRQMVRVAHFGTAGGLSDPVLLYPTTHFL